jgi:hypothetical protein
MKNPAEIMRHRKGAGLTTIMAQLEALGREGQKVFVKPATGGLKAENGLRF